MESAPAWKIHRIGDFIIKQNPCSFLALPDDRNYRHEGFCVGVPIGGEERFDRCRLHIFPKYITPTTEER